MIRKQSEQVIVQIEKPQGGAGTLTMKKNRNGPEELGNKGRAFHHCFFAARLGLGVS